MNSLLPLLLAALMLPCGLAHALVADRHSLRKAVAAAGPEIAAPDAARKIAAELRGLSDDVALERRLAVLAGACEARHDYALTVALFDELMAPGDLRGTLLAADVLLHRADAVEVSSFSSTESVRTVPAGFCDRAARLLAHENEIVQAIGEWVLALRLKKQNSSAKAIAERFHVNAEDAAWHGAWTSRGAKHHLRDDYARQLVQRHQHHSLPAIQSAVDEVHLRQQAMRLAEKVSADAEADAVYDKALAAARAAVSRADLGAALAAYLRLREAARAAVARRADFPSEGFAFFTGRSIPGGVWNVNVNAIGRSNPPGGEVQMKHAPDAASPAVPLQAGRLGEGSVRGMDVDWAGKSVLFSFWPQPEDKDTPLGWNEFANAHLYRMELKPGAAIETVTSDRGANDVEPSFLPDGGIVFASDRSGFGNQCAGPFTQDKRCTTLFRLPPGAGGKITAISNNKDFDRHPHVLNDGSLVFLHWEYQERGLYHTHAVWRCRPDGTGMDALFKQHLDLLMSIRDVRQVPDSSWCVATFQGHHDGHNGPMLLFDPAQGINNADAMRLVTAGCSPIERGMGDMEQRMVPQGGLRVRGGSFISPFPLSERGFIIGHDQTGAESEFAVYFLDVHGHLELLHRDAEMSCFSPIALRPRPLPPVLADVKKPDVTYATTFLENVHRDLPGIPPGEVKYLRISQSLPLPAPLYESAVKDGARYNHLHWLPGDATMSHFSYWSWSPSRTVGIVKVAPDGSAYFKVPAGTPVYLQALDKDYLEVRRMRTSFTLQRGEFRGCVGCHESRVETAGTLKAYPQLTLAAGPQTPQPAPWGDEVLDYRRHIQPIWNQHCVSCHAEKNPAGGLELTAREIGGFAQSYRALFGLKPDDATPVREMKIHLTLHPEAKKDRFESERSAVKRIHGEMQQNRWPGQLISIADRFSAAEITQPRQFGSHESRLIRVLLDTADKSHGNLRADMGHEAWLRLVTWVDYNANYHSTVMDKSGYERESKITRVPYRLPDIWQPADFTPLYLNRARGNQEDEGAPLPNTSGLQRGERNDSGKSAK